MKRVEFEWKMNDSEWTNRDFDRQVMILNEKITNFRENEDVERQNNDFERQTIYL